MENYLFDYDYNSEILSEIGIICIHTHFIIQNHIEIQFIHN